MTGHVRVLAGALFVAASLALSGMWAWGSASARPQTASAQQQATPTPAPAPDRPYVIEVPPPQAVDDIRAGRVPGVTLQKLGESLANVRGAQALAPHTSGAGARAEAAITGLDNGIVLLASYPDLAAAPGSTTTFYDNLLFSTAPGSMRSYFRENSYNQYDIDGTVAGWYTMPHNRNWYSDYDGVPNSTALCGYGDDYGCGSDPAHNTQQLIRDAVLAADPFVDFSQFAEGGAVRNLMIIHAGQGAEAASTCRICPWSVAWGPSGPLVVDGVSVFSAFVAAEYIYSAGDSKIGLYAHELGHLGFGLPDLYDTDYSSNGVGSWSLMSGGTWLNGGASPSHLDAWSKSYLGWLVPTVVASAGPRNIPAAETSPVALKLWTNGTPGAEYFLVENRQQTGFDSYLPGSGLLIWHVDEGAWSNSVDCHPRVLLVAADSSQSLPCHLSSSSGANPWPGTLGKTGWNGGTLPSSRAYSGSNTGVQMQSISPSGAVMTANIDVSGTAIFNDMIAGAFDISALPMSDSVNTSAATLEAGEAQPCAAIGKTVWYRLAIPASPPYSGDITVETAGSSFDAALAVYTYGGGPLPSSLVNIACNDDAVGDQAQVTFGASAGVTYYIQVGGDSGAGGALAFAAYEGQPKGRISGVVTNGIGVPIQGAWVSAQSVVCCEYSWATTDENGLYVMSDVQPGDYRVYASATGFAAEYYDDTYDYSAATLVAVAAGATTSGIDFALSTGGSIHGKVSDASGAKIPYAFVSAICDDCPGSAWGYTEFFDGSYYITGLPPGNYRIHASMPGYAGEYYLDTYRRGDAALVPVADGVLTGNINFSLGVGGSISGIVTNALGTPIAGATVEAECNDCDNWESATTAGDGSYTIEHVAPGESYRVYAHASGSAGEYYDDTQSWFDAQLLVPSEGGNITGVNFALAPAASISGNVSDDGTPLAAADVYVGCDICGVFRWTQTDAFGDYSVTDLPSGQYRVEARADGYVREYYDNVYAWNDATLIDLPVGTPLTGIDFDLDVGGSISGAVFASIGGAPLAGAEVYASCDSNCVPAGSWGYGSTDSNGAYTISGLLGGEFRVEVSRTGYASEYYDDTYDYELATLVPVTFGLDTPGINFALYAEARISGTVVNAQGTPIAGANVSADRDSCCSGNSDTTNSLGQYEISGLSPGDYRVEASKAGYARRYYDNTYDYDLAALVTTSSGLTTPDIDITLEVGGSISGTITNLQGTPVADAWVDAESQVCCSGGGASTDVNGDYTIVDLAPGVYDVSASADGYATTSYGSPVAVSAGGNTPGIDIALTPPENWWNARTIWPLPFADVMDTTGFGLDPDEPQPCGGIGATTWYGIDFPASPPVAGMLVVDTFGSTFDTVLAVYEGNAFSPPGGVEFLGCVDDMPGSDKSQFAFIVDEGRTYHVQVGGAGGEAGMLAFNAVFHADDDEDGCTDAHERGTNPGFGGDRNPADVWDYYDVTGDGRIDFSDTLAILEKFGETPGSGGYDARYDRYAPDGSKPYRTAAAVDEAGIDLSDALANLESYGHDCTYAPP